MKFLKSSVYFTLRAHISLEAKFSLETLYLHLDFIKFTVEKVDSALAGVAQWIECWTANQRVVCSIPSQGTYLGYRPDPQ